MVRNVILKETINYIGFCYRNILLSLTNIAPIEYCSVNYHIMYDDEKEFFTNHLPIRVIDILKLVINQIRKLRF